MNKNQTLFAIIGICLSIIMAGAIIAYKPGLTPEPTGIEFRYPTGTGTSLGQGAYTYVGEENNEKTISLSGSGTVLATSNQATVILGVQTEDDSAKDAIEENAELMNNVINAIKGLGFTDEDIKTVSYNVYPNYNWELRQVTGYTVTNMMQIKIMDLDIVGEVIDAAGAAGANRVDGINFDLSDDVKEQLKMDAYVAAIQDAEAKVNVITDTLGLEIIGIQSVTESSYAAPRVYTAYAEEAAMGFDARTPIVEGSLSVTVQVHIVYLIA
jgi:uncharacterized protein YggE